MGLKREMVMLPDEMIQRCRQYGQAIVDTYSAGLNAASLAVSSHGAEADPELQSLARMGECAFCLWADLDPLTQLRWDNRSDQGWDAIYGNYRIDVKTIAARKHYLIWPVNKCDFYLDKQFDALCLVKGNEPWFEIAKWISKKGFWFGHHVADEDQFKELTPGTWVMHEQALWPIRSFRSLRKDAT